MHRLDWMILKILLLLPLGCMSETDGAARGTESDASRDGMYVEDAAVIDVDVRESETQDAQPANELTDAGRLQNEPDAAIAEVCPATFDGPTLDGEAGPLCESGRAQLIQINGMVVDQDSRCVHDAWVVGFLDTEDQNNLHLRRVETSESGVFSIQLPEFQRCIQGGYLRIVGRNGRFAPTICRISSRFDEHVLNLRVPIVLPRTRIGRRHPERPDTLLFDDGIELVAGEMDILDWDEQPVGATLVEPDESCVFDGLSAPATVVAFSGNIFLDADVFLPMRVPNTMNLAPGARLDVFAQANDPCTSALGDIPRDEVWARVDSARVSDDGQMLVTEAGLNCLQWIAFVPRQE